VAPKHTWGAVVGQNPWTRSSYKCNVHNTKDLGGVSKRGVFYDRCVWEQPVMATWSKRNLDCNSVIHVSDRLSFLFWMEFQVPVAVGESDDGNDLQCVDPHAKLEEINNFNVTYSQLRLDERREISIGSVYPQEKIAVHGPRSSLLHH
jgi:hypothetical protein